MACPVLDTGDWYGIQSHGRFTPAFAGAGPGRNDGGKTKDLRDLRLPALITLKGHEQPSLYGPLAPRELALTVATAAGASGLLLVKSGQLRPYPRAKSLGGKCFVFKHVVEQSRLKPPSIERDRQYARLGLTLQQHLGDDGI